MGIDVIVTKGSTTKVDILEINAPPSLDTATGIPAAEDTHSGNVGGIFRQFVLGLMGEGGEGDRWMRLVPPVDEALGGVGAGGAVKARPDYNAMRSESVNKMKYNLFERKTLKRWEVRKGCEYITTLSCRGKKLVCVSV